MKPLFSRLEVAKKPDVILNCFYKIDHSHSARFYERMYPIGYMITSQRDKDFEIEGGVYKIADGRYLCSETFPEASKLFEHLTPEFIIKKRFLFFKFKKKNPEYVEGFFKLPDMRSSMVCKHAPRPDAAEVYKGAFYDL